MPTNLDSLTNKKWHIMMRGDYMMNSMESWSNEAKPEEQNNDSGISPGHSNAASSSPNSEHLYVESPESQKNVGSPHSDSSLRVSSPHGSLSPEQETQDGPLDQLKMALESSSALSGIFNQESSNADSLPNSPKKDYSCPLCAYTSPYRHRYVEHLNTHYADKCTLCKFQGKTVNDLRAHLIEVHNVDGSIDLTDPTDALSDGHEDDDPTGKRLKSKAFRCKQCSFVTNTKLEFWEHTKSHIKVEKLLTCPKCPFVTEYKHHLEYHLRNHFGSKPFKCNKCSYSCVNKSMLNSHLKSHSNIYQYRCADCAYATKYCHSLKLHLRKYEHNPAMVLNADGSPNPLPIIDVYGTRRGPKQKKKIDDEELSPNRDVKQNLPGGIVVPSAPQTSPKPFGLKSIDELTIRRSSQEFLHCSVCPFYTDSFHILNQHMLLHPSESPLSKICQTSNNNNNNVDKGSVTNYLNYMFLNSAPPSPISLPSQHSPHVPAPASPLDLSKTESDVKDAKPASSSEAKRNRRKGKAYKLERPADFVEVKMEVSEEPLQIRIPEFKPKNSEIDKTNSEYTCNFCDITFKNVVMYTMHMGYHGFSDPYTCNMCGFVNEDNLSFFLHIARSAHT